MTSSYETHPRKPQAQMNDCEVLGDRKWPEHLTVEQCREILAYQEKIGIGEGLQ